MTVGAAGGRRLDELAVAMTRRQGLKAMLGALALGLPLARAGRAAASHTTTDQCQKGCLYASGVDYQQRVSACDAHATTGLAISAVELIYGNFLGGYTNIGGSLGNDVYCRNQAVLRKKARQYDCLQPGCPGFDPDAPGGPCEPCQTANASGTPCKCCPCPCGPTGYVFVDPSQQCPDPCVC